MKKKQTPYKGIEQIPTLAIKEEYKNTIVKFRHPKLGEITYDTSLLGQDQETYRVFYKNGWDFLFTTASSSATNQNSSATNQNSSENPPLSSEKSLENGPAPEQKLT